MGISNALRAIQRRLCYDLIRIFDCDIPRELDEDFLYKTGPKDTFQPGPQKETTLPPTDSKEDKKDRKKNFVSFNQVKNMFSEQYIKKQQSNINLGRYDKIQYTSTDEME